MTDIAEKDYVIIVQCHIVKQRCSGYFCEKSFNERAGGFSKYPKDKIFRTIYMTCGGCCGRAVHRKLAHLARNIKKKDAMEKDRIVVQLSSCITKDNHHALPCPHLNYMKTLISRLGLDVLEDTEISKLSQQRRDAGLYSS